MNTANIYCVPTRCQARTAVVMLLQPKHLHEYTIYEAINRHYGMMRPGGQMC